MSFKLITLLSALIISTSAIADEAVWHSKAIELAIEEPKISDAKWSQDISLWVLVDDDGSKRDSYASYICLVLNQAGKPQGEFVAVTVWDRVSTSTDSPKQLGKAHCK